MKRFKLLIVLILCTLCGCSSEKLIPVSDVTIASENEEQSQPPTKGSQLLECRYYDETEFLSYDRRGEAYEVSGETLCGVVPHHLTAGYFISGFMKTAAESRKDIETVIIIAPMHYETQDKICTTESDWATAYGISRTDREITELFKNKLNAAVNDETVMNDHSASVHIPFIKYYFPNAKTACLLISKRSDKDIPEKLTEILSETADMKRCLFLFSIDFSHYLSPREADRMDEITRGEVLSGNTAAVELMTDDNVDSPCCLSTYMRLSSLFGGKVTAADNSNTFKITGKPYNRENYPEGVTSYFTFVTNK